MLDFWHGRRVIWRKIWSTVIQCIFNTIGRFSVQIKAKMIANYAKISHDFKNYTIILQDYRRNNELNH